MCRSQHYLTIIYNPPTGSNLDGALTAFVSQFINKPGASTVPQLLEGIVNTAECIWPSFAETGPTLQKGRPRSTAVTVVHKLDDSTDEVVKLRHENAELHRQNQLLQEEVARLNSILKQQTSETTSTDTCATSSTISGVETAVHTCTTTASVPGPIVCPQDTSVSLATPRSQSLCRSHIVASQQQLTSQQITRFNRLPRNLKDFYKQMESNEFSTLGDVYSRCVSTKSAYTKRKHVFQLIKNFPGGIDKRFAEFGMKSATWIYDHKIRNCRNN